MSSHTYTKVQQSVRVHGLTCRNSETVRAKYTLSYKKQLQEQNKTDLHKAKYSVRYIETPQETVYMYLDNNIRIKHEMYLKAWLPFCSHIVSCLNFMGLEFGRLCSVELWLA